jgi:hypothetical protein
VLPNVADVSGFGLILFSARGAGKMAVVSRYKLILLGYLNQDVEAGIIVVAADHGCDVLILNHCQMFLSLTEYFQ